MSKRKCTSLETMQNTVVEFLAQDMQGIAKEIKGVIKECVEEPSAEVKAAEVKAAEVKVESNVPEPNYFLRGFFWHEEGASANFTTYKLPKLLPKDLDPSLWFLRTIIPTEGDGADVIVPKLQAPHKIHSGYWEPKDDQEVAFIFQHEEISGGKDYEEFMFDILMKKLCGDPVKNACGRIFQCMVPTFD